MQNLLLRRAFNFSSSRLHSHDFARLEDRYGCHNYHPVPICADRAQGIYVYDQEGKQYMDFLSSYSAVNQGHCHPRIVAAMVEQASKLTLSSRAYNNNQLGLSQEYICTALGYDKVLFMNTGVEAGESAIKFARRWAYNVKGVADDHARVLFMKGNFWGRTIAACASSDDPSRYKGFGPFNGLGFDLVEFDKYLLSYIHLPYYSLQQIEQQLKNDKNYAAVMLEPIQGEKGVKVPSDGYLRGVRELCTKYNVLMIADEIQTGLGRAGMMLACDYEKVRPDILVLGKSLAGGLYPVSAMLCDDPIMMQILPGEHGSTFGGNPLGMAIMRTAMEVVRQEGLVENSFIMGERLMSGLRSLKYPFIKEVRGKGLMIGFELDSQLYEEAAWDLCIKLLHKGLITKPTHGQTLRLAPPLIIKDYEIDRAIETINDALHDFQKGL